MAGRFWWLAGWVGGLGEQVGRVGRRAGWGGGQDGIGGQVVGGGWIFGIRNVLE